MHFSTVSLAILSLAIPLAPTFAQERIQSGGKVFSQELYPILEKAGCRGCHVEDGVASTTRLRFPSERASSDQIEAFGRRLATLVNSNKPEGSLLLLKPTSRIEHSGGRLIAPGSPEEKVLIRWVEYLAGRLPNSAGRAGSEPETNGHAPVQPLVRRLTHSQYNNTIRDLLGDQTQPANQFPQEDFVNGFRNQADAQNIPPLLGEAYSAAAEKLAQNAYRRGFFKNLAKGGNGPKGCKGCGGQFIRSFGLRAFRRPLTETEYSRYAALLERETRRTGELARGAQIVVEAMLQSPNFLFRAERGAKGPWGNYEVASRLSYFLWDTMPDEELFQKAAAGQLSAAEEVEKVARRMLSDRRAQQAVDEFVSQWLRFDRLLSATRDRRSFPEFNSELAAAMAEEVKRLVAHLVWNNRNFLEIFTADYSFVNSDLASLYNLPSPSEEFGQTSFPATSGRSGVLGQAAFLTLTSKPAETSPTARGLFIREKFLCQNVPNPPPGTNMNLPLPSKTAPQGVRARLGQHQADPTCARCHALIDSIGFGFERFDAIGRERTKEMIKINAPHQERKAKPQIFELNIDSTAVVKGIPGSEFSSPKELGRLLAATPACQDCVVKQLFRYALGRMETPTDRPALERAQNVFRRSEFRFKELMVALVSSEAFLN